MSDQRSGGRTWTFPYILVLFLVAGIIAALWMLQPEVTYATVAFCAGACISGVGTLIVAGAVMINRDENDEGV